MTAPGFLAEKTSDQAALPNLLWTSQLKRNQIISCFNVLLLYPLTPTCIKDVWEQYYTLREEAPTWAFNFKLGRAKKDVG